MTSISGRLAYALALAAGGLSAATSTEAQRGFGFSESIVGNLYVGHIRDRSRYMPHQGKRECARRRRQMGLA